LHGPTNSPAPEDAPSKASGSKRDAPRHATLRAYRGIGQPQVNPCRSGQEKEWETPFLRGLQKIKRCHKERLFPLARTDDTLDTMAGAKWFSTLDLKSRGTGK
jgi:hypothetical protein